MTRPTWVGHADVDAFYASVEERDCPAYRGRPVVVGARPGQRGVVAAANYAARRYGIHSAMPIAEASRRCPHAVFLRPDMAKYSAVSRQVFDILRTVTPVVEPVSIDEAYLDLGGLERLSGPPEAIGRDIRARVMAGTGLTVSVGIGPNRLIAKLASEACKPDGLRVVPPTKVAGFLGAMPIERLRGMGGKTQQAFARLGIRSVAQLRSVPLPYLEQHVGHSLAAKFHAQAHGLATAEVCPARARKSLSKETTFATDRTDPPDLRDVLRLLAAEVAARARREGLAGAVVTLKVRYAGFDTHTRQRRLAQATHDEGEILRTAWSLFRQGDLPSAPVRLIGVGISDWADTAPPQADLFEGPRARQKRESLLATIDRARERFGHGALGLGMTAAERHGEDSG
jgi:DNA polymerase-4